jgi:ABC-type Mn2+/Zn2+ transport system permease subunit
MCIFILVSHQSTRVVRNSSRKVTFVSIYPTVVVIVGAAVLRQAFTEVQLPGIVLSYMLALKSVYAFIITLAGTTTMIGAFSSWKSIKGKVVMGVA